MVLSSPSISIIIPVYNVEKYWAQESQSIFDQTYTNMQIICINDGSTDGSVTILRRFAETNPRIEVNTQANLGCSAAWNSAIQKMRDEHLMFVDADDWLYSDACKRAVSLMEEESADPVLWAYRKDYGTHSEEVKVGHQKRLFEPSDMPELRRPIPGLTAEEMRQPEFMDSFRTLSRKLYRSKVFSENNIKIVDLDEIGSAEDVLVNLYYTAYASKAVYIQDCLYHYRKTNTRFETRNYHPRPQTQCQHLFKRMESWIEQFDASQASREVMDNRTAYALVELGLNDLDNDKMHSRHFTYIKQSLHTDWYCTVASRLALKQWHPTEKSFLLRQASNDVVRMWAPNYH